MLSRKSQGFIVFIIIFISGCITYIPKTVKRNDSAIYNPVNSFIKPEYLIYHKADSSSTLLIQIDPKDLFNQYITDIYYKTKIGIHYALYNSLDKMQLIDSGSVNYILNSRTNQNRFISYIPFTTTKKKCVMQVTITNFQRNIKKISYLNVDKTSANSPQCFTINQASTKEIIFNNNFKTGDTFCISYPYGEPDSIFVYYYNSEFNLPPPPFYTREVRQTFIKPDSVVRLAYSPNTVYNPGKTAIIQFRVDTTDNEGLTLYHYHEYYPDLRTSEELLRPLQYLTSSKEFKRMQIQTNKKSAIDDFWLKASGNVGRAKEQIKTFYNRVIYANTFFSSYTEGWRTDRGIIYIVFGPPLSLYKTDTEEKWIYGDNRNLNPITFVFHKKDSPFSDNHYVLERNSSYKSAWHNAVATWRQGKIYYINH